MSSYGAMGDSKPMGEAERLLDNSMQTNEATEEMGAPPAHARGARRRRCPDARAAAGLSLIHI